jgi:hypothetical protein
MTAIGDATKFLPMPRLRGALVKSWGNWRG